MAAVTLFQNFLFYMFFLMVVLLLNYSDSETAAHSLRLRTQLQRAFHSLERGAVGRYGFLTDVPLPGKCFLLTRLSALAVGTRF